MISLPNDLSPGVNLNAISSGPAKGGRGVVTLHFLPDVSPVEIYTFLGVEYVVTRLVGLTRRSLPS